MGHDHTPVDRPKVSKRHCLLRDIVLKEPLWAGSEADWKIVLENRSAVICDVPSCREPLVVVNTNPAIRARHFAYRPNQPGCGHHANLGPDDEKTHLKAEISPRHLWMQDRLATICRQLGYETTVEHWPTRADVYVQDTKTALEVQQRPTKFAKRTATRTKNGAVQTIWLLSHDANEPPVRSALFEVPAARFKVIDTRQTGSTRAIEFAPWKAPEELDDYAGVDVWATTWRLIDEKPYLLRCHLDLRDFLDQVLSGRRIWVRRHSLMPLNKAGHPESGWVLQTDLDTVRDRKNRDANTAAAEKAKITAPQTKMTTSLVAEPPKPAVAPTPTRPPIPSIRQPTTAPRPTSAMRRPAESQPTLDLETILGLVVIGSLTVIAVLALAFGVIALVDYMATSMTSFFPQIH
ncbi:hypothetical protein [Mycobacteroides abscessus]|uniref:hypothetical protein n=1 Tax=Mycobacteroides abscessus TaxID=36809 RepID=UPI0013000D29|nr:hypothetical protein [Mycobacteroides abscessus]